MNKKVLEINNLTSGYNNTIGSKKTNTISRTLRILHSICKSKQGITISKAAKEFDISASLMHNYIKYLKEEAYIFKDTISGRYRATLKVAELGRLVIGNNEIGEISYSILSLLSEELKSTIHLSIRENDLGVCVSKVGHSEAIPSITRVGMRFDLYSTALGKAILAFLEDEEINNYLSQIELIPYTPNTIVDPAALLEELKLTRKRKYSIDNEEHRMGLRALGLPIFNYTNKPIGSISALLFYNADEQEIDRIFKAMYSASKKISVQLGSSKFENFFME